ncbi:MAG: HNH endonuclease [Clostridium sp.]|nr:HNH endonuclease [Clostridium sp.]MCM1400244.1 HNH endonuclease [Clostridium sp.]MCM1460957.1 HNH endonuclease [Bacteroides sp.]
MSIQRSCKGDGMMTYKGSRWQKKRAYILKRDGYKCRECARYGRMRDGVHVHHVYPVEYYPSEAYNNCNLITLCAACHNKMHNRDTHELTACGKELQKRIKQRYGSRLPPSLSF